VMLTDIRPGIGDMESLFPEACSRTTTGNSHKLPQEILPSRREITFPMKTIKHWNRLPKLRNLQPWKYSKLDCTS